MNDYFAEEDPTKRDAIAAHQLDILKSHQGAREKELRLSNISETFVKMREHLKG
jgi:hypothetical protein